MAWVALGVAAIGAAAKMSQPGASPAMMPGGSSGANQDGSGWVVNFGKGSLVGSSGGADSSGLGGLRLETVLIAAAAYMLLKK